MWFNEHRGKTNLVFNWTLERTVLFISAPTLCCLSQRHCHEGFNGNGVLKFSCNWSDCGRVHARLGTIWNRGVIIVRGPTSGARTSPRTKHRPRPHFAGPRATVYNVFARPWCWKAQSARVQSTSEEPQTSTILHSLFATETRCFKHDNQRHQKIYATMDVRIVWGWKRGSLL